MSSDQRSNLRIFLDHLYFSLCCVFVGFLLVYHLADWTGHGFDLDKTHDLCIFIGAAVSLILASVFTFMSISRRPKDSIDYTKRQY